MQRPPFRLFSVAACIILVFSHSLLADQATSDKAWTVLQAGLDKKGEDRATAVRVLGLVPDDAKATQTALNALDDTDYNVRAAAAEALGQMHAKEAIPKLEGLIPNEKEPSVIMASANSLIALGDTKAYNVYYAILTGEQKSGAPLLDEQKKMLHDPKKMAQFGFEQGLGFIPFAGLGYTAVKSLAKDDSSPVRAAAARVLAKDSDPKSKSALIDATTDKSWIVRAAALNALALRNDPSVVPNIQSALDDDKSAVRYTAAATIIHLGEVKPPKPARPSAHRATR